MTRIAPAEPPYEPAIADALARIDRRAIAEVTWTALAEHFDAVQILETIALAGYYHAISFLCLGLELPLESYAARFPAVPSAGWGFECDHLATPVRQFYLTGFLPVAACRIFANFTAAGFGGDIRQ
jgi:hypothetical protein